MRCDLMEANGLSGDCATNGCVYWSLLGRDGEKPVYQCALAYYGLIGPKRDRLARWLLELKLKTRASRERQQGNDVYAARARFRAAEWSATGAGYVPPAGTLPVGTPSGVNSGSPPRVSVVDSSARSMRG